MSLPVGSLVLHVSPSTRGLPSHVVGGGDLLNQFVLGRWSQMEREFSINLQELCAIHLGLLHFHRSLLGQPVRVFSNNTTALSYIKKQGGMFSAALNHKAHLLRWTESLGITLVPQFIMEAWNVMAASLNRQDQVIGSKWTLAQEVVDELRARWPAMVNLFATFLNYRLPIYFSTLNNPMAVGTDAFLQSWDGLQAYVFPPFALVRRVINKLRSCKGTLLTLVAPLWPQMEWLLQLRSPLVAPPATLPLRADLLRQPHVHRLHQNLHVLQVHVWRLSSDVYMST